MYSRFGTLTFVTPYGLMLAVALLACWHYARRRAVRFGIDTSHIDLIVPLVFAAGVLGTWIFAATTAPAAFFAGDSPAAHTRFSVFGLLAFTLPALYVYGRRAGLPVRRLLDLFALPTIACLMLVRLGCFMAGCCWGDLVIAPPHLADSAGAELAAQVFTLPWISAESLIPGVSFPAESFAWRQHLELGLIDAGAASSLPVHPVQLYEFALLAILLIALRRLETRWTTPGVTVLTALGAYAALRFIIEFLRADSSLLVGRMTFAQLVAAMLFAASLAVVVAVRKNPLRDASAAVFE